MTYRSGAEHSQRYKLRRLFETKIRYVLWTILVILPVALMPLVSRGVKDWLLLLGFASIVTGVISAAGAFLRSRSGSAKEGLTMSIIAPIGAGHLLYGLLILAYVWAELYWHAFTSARHSLHPRADGSCGHRLCS